MINDFPFQPLIRVGITENSGFGIKLEGGYDISSSEDSISYIPKSDNSYIEISGIEIGKEFHWNRKESQKFKGVITLHRNEHKTILINTVPVETYLKSVISSEMSPDADMEFLKVHAIISRSWALRMIGRKKPSVHLSPDRTSSDNRIIMWTDISRHSEYDVCADDHCQRYQGFGRTNRRAEDAVELTRGMVLVDKDMNIADARFSKCCGGTTEKFSTCWSDEDYHYLQSVEDPYCNPLRAEKIKHLIMNDYDLETTDYYLWERNVDANMIFDNLKQKFNLSVGEISDIIPLKRGASGRISELKVIGNSGEIIIGKELMIRKLLSDTHLYSSNFEVERIENSENVTFKIRGCGWGHGVGLCQIGAAVMASEGYNYEEMLNHYYKGAKIEKIYE